MQRYKELINDFLGKIYLRSFITAVRSLKILEVDYGHYLSSVKWDACDKNGNPIPWFTYPAIEYLKQLDLSKKNIFEWGSGNSTLFWLSKAKSVISVENNLKWYKKVLPKLKQQKKLFNLIYAPKKNKYLDSINKKNKVYDIIIIDGSFRYDCAKICFRKLNKGGMIILDNSNWFPKTSEFLRKMGLIEINMAGFAPIIPNVSVTSFFLRRDYIFTYNKNKPTNYLGTIIHKLG